jgi:two-component system phosphate regulon sensor histidine kinase PhoR
LRNLKPFHILLGGSAVVGFLSFVLLLVLYLSGTVIAPVYLAIIPILVAVITYAVFHFFIKKFLTERLRLLYRSIRKGKFEENSDKHFKMSDDVISTAEEDTRRWSEEQDAEILTLKEQAEFRREFLGNLAHELKTPVFSIQGYILTLLDGGLEDEAVNRKFLERASKATDRMSGILEDLDLLMKFEVNEIHLDLQNFDVKELVQDIFEDLEMKARKKDITLRFAKEFNPLFVRGDRGKIGQVLSNLINNSISYGNDGGETSVRFYIFDDLITIEVSDNGLGIDESHLPRLFERFYRVEKSRNRNEGGSGLGLAIAKHIIESHDQTITVRSTPDVGSTFTFGLDKGKS